MKSNFQLLPPEGQAAALEVIKARLSSPGMSAAGASEVKKITEIFMDIYGIERQEKKVADAGKDGTAQSASELTGQSKPKLALTDGAPASGGFPDAAKVQAKQFKVHKAEMNISVNVDKGNLDKLEVQLKRIAGLQQGIESRRPFLACQDELRIREAINKAVTKALQQGGPLHESMSR